MNTAQTTSQTRTKAQTAEIVTFRVTPQTTADAVAVAADGMTPFLQSTGAFISRTLSCDDDGLWTDHITWTTRDAAEQAAAAMMQRPEAGAFMSMIDPETVSMRHAMIHKQME